MNTLPMDITKEKSLAAQVATLKTLVTALWIFDSGSQKFLAVHDKEIRKFNINFSMPIWKPKAPGFVHRPENKWNQLTTS